MPGEAHGKEGVNGSSPLEGFLRSAGHQAADRDDFPPSRRRPATVAGAGRLLKPRYLIPVPLTCVARAVWSQLLVFVVPAVQPGAGGLAAVPWNWSSE